MLVNAVVVIVALSIAILGFKRKSWLGSLQGVAGVLLLVAAGVGIYWSQLVNLVMPYEYRPEAINFPVEQVDDSIFDTYSRELIARYDNPTVSLLSAPALESAERSSSLAHIRRFRKAGINSYEGPETCISCHEQIRVSDGNGGYEDVDLRENLTSTTHFTFAPMTGFSTFGFNGERVVNFPLGKLDRACGVTGTFTWTGWAVTVENAYGEEFSEGCGQCHIVGQYGPISGAMMPGYTATDAEFAATDCLVCHAAEYDMNLREVVAGRQRQDSLESRQAPDRGDERGEPGCRHMPPLPSTQPGRRHLFSKPGPGGIGQGQTAPGAPRCETRNTVRCRLGRACCSRDAVSRLPRHTGPQDRSWYPGRGPGSQRPAGCGSRV